MKVLPNNIKNISLIELNKSNELIVTINESAHLLYSKGENSDDSVLEDILECKAYATALLYLNENYKLTLDVGIINESNISDFYSDCEDLLNKNISIVEEVGIPLCDINGYKIFEGAGYILRGNGAKKIKETFNESLAFDKLNKKLDELIANNATDSELNDFIELAADNEDITNDEYNTLLNKAQDTRRIESVNEDEGTQTTDIAPKVDQKDGVTPAKPEKKKHYDILLSGLEESFSIVNKGFLKNSMGQYQRGNYILVKEGEQYLAVHKDKLN